MHCCIAARAGAQDGFAHGEGRHNPRRHRLSISKSNDDCQPSRTLTLVTAPVIQERHEERTCRDLNSVDFREGDAPTDPIRVLDEDRISRGSIFHCRLVLAPRLRNAGIDRQERSAESQAEQAFDPRALQPACRARVPGPAPAPDMRRCRVYVGADDIGFDFVAIRVGAGSRVVDGVEQREKLGRLVALAERGERHHRPGRRVRVLAAVLANARRIALDVSRIVRRLVERRREQQRQSVIAPNQLPIERGHRAGRAIGRLRRLTRQPRTERWNRSDTRRSSRSRAARRRRNSPCDTIRRPRPRARSRLSARPRAPSTFLRATSRRAPAPAARRP